MSTPRDNFKAGLFVIFGMILALAVIYLLADFESLTREEQTVNVFYSLGDGVQGLKEGAAVTIGHLPAGEVDAIMPVMAKDGSGRTVGMKVTILVPKEIQLYWDAQIELDKPAIGSGTSLNIRSVGGRTQQLQYSPDSTIPAAVVPDWAIQQTDKPRADLTPDEILAAYVGPIDCIPGALAGSALVRSMATEIGIESQQRAQIKSIISNIESITSNLRDELPQVVDSARETMIKAKGIADKADGSMEDIRSAIKDVKETTALVKQKVEGWSDKIEGSLDDVRQTASKARKLVEDKTPTISDTLDNLKSASADVKEVTGTVKNKTLQQVTDALDKASQALENLKAAASSTKTLIVGQKPVLERAIANAQIVSDQLKLASIEIRRSPWRLLHAPTEEEIETDQLYDAARSFALAAGALDSATQQLKAISADQPNSEEVEKMLAYLSALFSKFEKAEERFWSKLGERGQSRPRVSATTDQPQN